MKRFILALPLLLATGPLYAISSLQLNIDGGTYDPVTQTIIGPNDTTFDLYAYYNPGKKEPAIDDSWFQVYMSLLPTSLSGIVSFTYQVGSAPPVTVDINTTMQGTPSYIRPHGIYPSPYQGISFYIPKDQLTEEYNTDECPSCTPIKPTTAHTMYWQVIHFDTTHLPAGSYLHFDLAGNQSAISEPFAWNPYSHDAQSYLSSNPGPDPIPAPSTFALLGTALFSLGGFLTCRKLRP